MSLLEYPSIMVAAKKKHVPASDLVNQMSMQFGTDDLAVISNMLQKAMYSDVDYLANYRGIKVFKGERQYDSIYEMGTPYFMSINSAEKADAQKTLWQYVKGQLDGMIADGCSQKVILNRYRWLRLVDSYNLEDMPAMCHQLGIASVDADRERNARFLSRTAKWLYYCITNYLSESAQKEKRPEHMTKSKLYNMIVDGVVWNPYQFRRFLPFQFLNKMAAFRGDYVFGRRLSFDGDFVDYMNSIAKVSLDYRLSDVAGETCVREGYSLSYITSDRMRALGYAEDADLIESFGDLEVVKTAIMFFERGVLVRDAGRGIDVTGRFNEINDRVKHMDRWEVSAYLDKVYKLHWDKDTVWYKDGDWKRLKSGLF